MFKARKVTPILLALLVAGFIVIQFDVIRKISRSVAQDVPLGGFSPPGTPQTDSSTPASRPWFEAPPEVYPEPIDIKIPSDEDYDTEVTPSKPFGNMVDGVPRNFDRREIFSLTSPDRKFWPILYTHDNSSNAYNANLIPHPIKPDHWVVVAQRAPNNRLTWPAVELTCAATFVDGALRCVEDATPLPTIRSIIGACPGKLFYLNVGGGPRDARVFYGRNAPFVIYGSQATYTCFSLWMHDLSIVSPEFRDNQSVPGSWYRNTVELRRPAPWGLMEKNYFVFWDTDGNLHAHFTTWPKRSFARLNYDGSSGPDLAPAAAAHDQACMAKILLSLPSDNGMESIHQATNSVQVTMCKRSDPTCVPTDDNTFVMAIYHQTAYYRFHGVYEPFVWLFRRAAPFEIHAISQRPFLVSGRNNLTAETTAWRYQKDPSNIPTGHTEMFYITSINWRNPGQYDHGYIDDVIHIAFGIEDTRSGVIDVTVGDLLQDLSFCGLA